MKINNHRLMGDDGKPAKYVESPNHGGALKPRYLVMHYTAGDSATSTVTWFLNKQAKASAHVIVGRAGEIIQMVPFNVVAWHAGASSWIDRQSQARIAGLNACSIGIELVNVGRLSRDAATKRWTSSRPRREFEDADVLTAIHKAEAMPCGWLRYTPRQLEVAAELCAAIARVYGITDVFGHDDVAPGRKFDPGPAFPMETFRRDVLKASASNVV